jgi:hypothetical protein
LVGEGLRKERSTAVHPNVEGRVEAVAAYEPGDEIGLADAASATKVTGYLIQDGGNA